MCRENELIWMSKIYQANVNKMYRSVVKWEKALLCHYSNV